MTEGIRRIDSHRLNVGTGEILSVVCVRNENLRLPHLFDYHRRLGVDRFFVVDNNSQDGTTDYLLTQPDVHVFTTTESYSHNSCGVDWLNSILDKHAIGHWTLSLDADELFVYPFCEQADLRHLVEQLDRRSENAVLTFLLDMYGDRAIRDTIYSRGEPFLETCRFFDRDSYIWDPSNEIYGRVPLRGGPRSRLFWAGYDRKRPPPFLPKIPLAKWRAGLEYTASTHLLAGVVLAELTGVLLHFKLFSDFIQRAGLEANLGEHCENAPTDGVRAWLDQNIAYREVIEGQPLLNPQYDGSVRYESSRQLAELGLAKVSPEFRALLF